MQPYIFPYIGYFQLIKEVDVFVIFDDVNFIKKGWINRNNFLLNGDLQRFTIPLKNVSQNKLICDTYIDEESGWKESLVKTVLHNYRNAPFYESISSLLQMILRDSHSNIALFNYNSIIQISKYLKLNTEFVLSSKIEKDISKRGSHKILDICKRLGAKEYINAIGGVDLYSKEVFTDEDIDLKFLKPSSVQYKQFDNDFVPWLSIIDVLMFNSIEDSVKLLNEYTLI